MKWCGFYDTDSSVDEAAKKWATGSDNRSCKLKFPNAGF